MRGSLEVVELMLTCGKEGGRESRLVTGKDRRLHLEEYVWLCGEVLVRLGHQGGLPGGHEKGGGLELQRGLPGGGERGQ